MDIQIHLFGITKDIIGSERLNITVKNDIQAQELITYLKNQYPKLDDLNSLLLAVNQAYAQNDLIINSSDELALIPPVSGG